MAEVRYKEVMHDGPRTLEQQTYLLAKAAADAWKAWSVSGGGPSADFNDAMRGLFIVASETDIFMGGYAAGKGR